MMNNGMDFDFEELINQLRSMLNPSEGDSSPLASAPRVINEAASHDFAQYRFLFTPTLFDNSDESHSSEPPGAEELFQTEKKEKAAEQIGARGGMWGAGGNWFPNSQEGEGDD